MSPKQNIFSKIFGPFVSLYHFIMGLAGLEFEEESQATQGDAPTDPPTPGKERREQENDNSPGSAAADSSEASQEQPDKEQSGTAPGSASAPTALPSAGSQAAGSQSAATEESVRGEARKLDMDKHEAEPGVDKRDDARQTTRTTNDASVREQDVMEEPGNQLQTAGDGIHKSPDFHEALTEIVPRDDDPFVDSESEIEETTSAPVDTIEDEASAAETIVAETGDADGARYDDTINHLLSEHTKLIESANEQQDEGEDDDAEARQAQRDVRAAENRARLARLEEEMAAVIAANAARAAKRKNEIDQELQKNEANVARLRAEREKLMKKRLEEAEARLAELTTGLKQHEDEAKRLTTERKLIIEGLAKAKTMEKESLNQIGSRSTQAVERARALARQQKAQADKRAREIMEQRKKRQEEIRAAREASTASKPMNQKTGAPGRHDAAEQRARMVANARAQQERQRSEQLQKQREAQQMRIKAAAQEKARREAARAAQIEQERQARLAAVKAKAKAEEEARRQALQRRKESNEQK